MSLFGSLLGDMEDDPFFGSHMRTMRHMNTMMNSLFADPFGMFSAGVGLDNRRALTHGSSMGSLMPFGGFPPMPSLGSLLGGSLDSLSHGGGSHGFSSSTVVSMTTGPDGRPQVYKATSSTRTAPGGVKETQRTVTDSRTGTKKMAIGHHIGDRAHIIEREQNLRSGDREERQDFINIEEDEAEEFNREWEQKSARSRSDVPRITAGGRHAYGGGVPAITAGSSRRQRDRNAGSGLVSSRRSIRSSPLVTLPDATSSSTSPSHSSTNRRPYSPPGHTQPRKSRNIKTVSGSSHQHDSDDDDDDDGVKIEEIN